MLCVVGDRHGDKVRNIYGGISTKIATSGGTVNLYFTSGTSAIYGSPNVSGFGTFAQAGESSMSGTTGMALDSNRIVPTGSFNTPRAFGSMACVWLGS